ncbi:MAG: hypothetical protein ACYC3W_05285 [Candidatus Nanopelagicales bacterium]
MGKHAKLMLGLIGVGAAVSACTAGANDAATTGGTYLAGFWPGLWEGLISPITFLVSLFNDKVGIYEVHNNGNWYNFGFMLGVSIALGAPARAGAGAAGKSKS